MKKRLARLHQTVVDALVEADAIRELGRELGDRRPLDDVGIALDKAREALEQMVWSGRADDQHLLQ